jgi:hypothetical protein
MIQIGCREIIASGLLGTREPGIESIRREPRQGVSEYRKGENMSTKEGSRRSFLASSVAGLNAALVAANWSGIVAAQQYVNQTQPPRLTVFTEAQANEIEAIAAQIIPTDDTPGAREARCVYFIDRALATFARNSRPTYKQGLQDLQAKAEELYPSAAKF